MVAEEAPEATTVALLKSFPVMLMNAPLLIASWVLKMLECRVSVELEVKLSWFTRKVVLLALSSPPELT